MIGDNEVLERALKKYAPLFEAYKLDIKRIEVYGFCVDSRNIQV